MSSAPYVTCQEISKSYSAKPLFSGLEISFLEQERTGLIGPNGSGKSTLLKILAGHESPDSGSIILRRDIRLAYLPQTEDFSGFASIEQALMDAVPIRDAQAYVQVQKTAGRMGFYNLDEQVTTLSGGRLKRLAMARVLVQKPDLVLLDEPTNHLDLEGILVLEKILSGSDFAFIVVSHDRAFLENITTRIVELNRIYPKGYLEVAGSYSRFLERRQEFISSQERLEQGLANKTRREVEWLRQGVKARTTKARYRKEKAFALQDELSEVRSRTNRTKTAEMEFSGTGRKTRKLIKAENLALTRLERILFEDLSFILSPGNCLGIMGPNGAGKSSLLGLLAGEMEPDQGSVVRAPELRVVLFDQQKQELDRSQTLKEALCPSGDQVIFQDRAIHVVTWAKKMLFTPEQLALPVSRLSGGEQSRLLIARLMLEPADVLLLDEPTNDLDIPTLEILEQSLLDFAGAVVLISHDRMFVDTLCDRLLLVDGTGRAEFFADYHQLARARDEQDKAGQPEKKEARSRSRKPTKMSYKDQLEYEAIEKKIEQAEDKVNELRREMEMPEVMSHASRLEELYARLEQAEEKAAALYARWEDLERIADEFRG
ncbi:ABC-F family ATP-binding cassette domain-containing protein [Desulfonatronovibrio hydrogenovorans]|uniref:ABC-F family ATP-binding cassette domain-containing protein n=1 Tax=Desulfonatronovibrio hydrogenovorans TaxID=53245 RepID=UPI0004917176|nr:ABC-F family ATP-binding cassette domain-containing protein [Desulfonatronovibrio hydrogenovorans]